MLHCLFQWFFELIIRSCLILLVCFFLYIEHRIILSSLLLTRSSTFVPCLLIVEVEDELENGAIFAILSEKLISLVELTYLCCLLYWLLLLSADQYALLLVIRRFFAFV